MWEVGARIPINLLFIYIEVSFHVEVEVGLSFNLCTGRVAGPNALLFGSAFIWSAMALI